MAKRIFMCRKGEPWVDTGLTIERAMEIIQKGNPESKQFRLATLIVDGVVNWDQPECLTGGEFKFEVREVPDNTEGRSDVGDQTSDVREI